MVFHRLGLAATAALALTSALSSAACSDDDKNGDEPNTTAGTGDDSNSGGGSGNTSSSGGGGTLASRGGTGGTKPAATAGRSGSGGAAGSSKAGEGGTMATPIAPPGPPGCGLDNAAFCDTFDKASPGGRAGDLDDLSWGAARISGINNLGQGQYNMWGSTTTSACGKDTAGVSSPNDMFFCSGGATESMRFNDSHDDAGAFTVHSVGIRQPFDFKGRTGTIAFDVGGKGGTPGGHGFWFNIFIADEPVPAPYQAGQAIALYARAGLGIEFESQCSRNLSANTVSNIFIEKNYEIVDEHKASDAKCFKTEEDVLNHMEIKLSETSVEVWASDAGKPETLRMIYSQAGLDLGFSRGYVNLQHTHYNASKCSFTTTTCEDCDNPACPTLESRTTYHWDNVGFDGPVLPMPRSYEFPDALVKDKGPYADNDDEYPGPYMNLGYLLGSDQGGKDRLVKTLTGVDLTKATSAAITLNAWEACSPESLDYRFNGGTWRSFALPFPDCDHSARAVLIPVALTDLKAGENTFEMYSKTGGMIVSNADLLIDVEP